MTLAVDTAKSGPYAGNGVTTNFVVTFYFLRNSDIEVIFTDTTGAETTYVENTHYTVNGAGNLLGGSIDIITTPTDYTPQTGEKITIIRAMPFTQQIDYVSNDPFPAETHERGLDELTMECQELKEQIGRALLVSVSSGLTGLTLPTPEAGLAIGWNATEDGLTNLTIADLGTETLPATADTYLKRNSLNTFFSALTSSQVWADIKVDATELVRGIAEIATQAEVNAGSDDERFVTPLKLFNYLSVTGGAQRGYIDGFNTAQDVGDLNHDIIITAGVARTDDNIGTIAFGSSMIKQDDANWAIGTNAGGMAAPVATASGGTYNTVGTAVTGILTSFTTDFQVGDVLWSSSNSQARRITVITSNTAMTLESAFTAPVVGDVTMINGLAPNTWYHLHALIDAFSAVDFGMDTRRNGALILADVAVVAAGFNNNRRIGSFKTNASSNIIAYKQRGNWWEWTDLPVDWNSAGPSTSGQLFTVSTPFGVECRGSFSARTNVAGGASFSGVLFTSPSQTNAVVGSTNSTIFGNTNTLGESDAASFELMTNDMSQIRIRRNAGSGFVFINMSTNGYWDFRGENA